MSKDLVIYCDGACLGNPNGRGGWGFAVYHQDQEIFSDSGFESGDGVTNNKMELTAALCAVEYLLLSSCYKPSKLASGSFKDNADAKLQIVTDSKYVQMGVSQWMHSWAIKGWRGSNNKPIKNLELWKRIYNLCSNIDIHWSWVKGHSGDVQNDRADYLASEAAKLAPRPVKMDAHKLDDKKAYKIISPLPNNAPLNDGVLDLRGEGVVKNTKDNIATNKVYLKVPFKEKDQAKSIGARWDSDKKLWFIPLGTCMDNFNRWI